MFWRRTSCAIFLSAMLTIGQIASAAEISLSDIIATVLDKHPDLNISRTDTALAAADAQRVASLLDATVSGNISGSNEQIPVSGDFQAVEKRTASIAGSISKPLSNGDILSVQGSYKRSGQDFISPFAAALARFNPAYRTQLDITYRHALLRGAERPDYSLGLQSVEAKTTAAALNEHLVARSLALRALNAFFQLAANDINVAIARQAVKRARDVLAYQRSREKFGLIEKADRLQAEALLAARNMDLQRARAQRQTNESALNRLMLKKSNPAITLRLPPLSPDRSVPDINEIEPQALLQRPDIRVLDARLKAAEADLAAVRDIDAMQLDVVAQLGTRALDSSAGVAAAGGFSTNDRFVSLSLEMQDTLGRNNARTAIRKAELARQRLSGQRRQTAELIRDDLAAAITAIRTGIPNLSMARKLAVAEKRKYKTELKRYREGRSDTATLVQFEGELRNAELQARLQQLTLQFARHQLRWATGDLLANLNIDLNIDLNIKPAATQP
ncbi:MAG: TolC family protein [Mariprofundaceae bacterium]